ncbi:MAG: MBL fold metallo-hydrolase [Bacteroidales bacterium]|nr:MBL fold metallo-hydrolase [Bacteroidales bacterium]
MGVFLFDCGEGTQLQLRRNRAPFGKINTILISHMHGDHVFGLFGLFSTFALLGLKHEITVIGPSEINPLIDFYKKHYGYTDMMPIAVVNPLPNEASLVLETSNVNIHAVPLTHKTTCFAYVVAEKPLDLNLRKDALQKYNIPVRSIYGIKKGGDFTLENGSVIPNHQLTLLPYKPRKYAFVTDTVYKESMCHIL